MPFKVKNAICTNTGEKVIILRSSLGHYDDEGIWIPGTVSQIKALASVQQPTKQQLELFTGLERTKDMKTFYVNKRIISSNEFDSTESDNILWNGKTYRAMELGDWNSFGYSLVLGVRIK